MTKNYNLIFKNIFLHICFKAYFFKYKRKGTYYIKYILMSMAQLYFLILIIKSLKIIIYLQVKIISKKFLL